MKAPISWSFPCPLSLSGLYFLFARICFCVCLSRACWLVTRAPLRMDFTDFNAFEEGADDLPPLAPPPLPTDDAGGRSSRNSRNDDDGGGSSSSSRSSSRSNRSKSSSKSSMRQSSSRSKSPRHSSRGDGGGSSSNGRGKSRRSSGSSRSSRHSKMNAHDDSWSDSSSDSDRGGGGRRGGSGFSGGSGRSSSSSGGGGGYQRGHLGRNAADDRARQQSNSVAQRRSRSVQVNGFKASVVKASVGGTKVNMAAALPRRGANADA